MTNEAAIKMIRDKHRTENKAEKLAAMYAMDDIIFYDIEIWLNTPTYKLIEQFVCNGLELLEDYMCEIFTDEDKQRAFAEDAMNIAEAMYHYTFLHCKLRETSESAKVK